MEKQIKIKSAQISDDFTLGIELQKITGDGESRAVDSFIIQLSDPAHGDFRDALYKIRMHMCRLCNLLGPIAELEEFKEHSGFVEMLLGRVRITRIQWKSSNQIHITGFVDHQFGGGGMALNRLVHTGQNTYPFMDDFIDDIDQVQSELRMYLGGKSHTKQLSLFETNRVLLEISPDALNMD